MVRAFKIGLANILQPFLNLLLFLKTFDPIAEVINLIVLKIYPPSWFICLTRSETRDW